MDLSYFELLSEDDKAKEIYARFGLCVYTFQTFEQQLMNLILAKSRAHAINMTPAEYDLIFKSYSDKTMGELKKKVINLYTLPKDIKKKLEIINTSRNYFVHHYFKDNSHLFFSDLGQRKMLKEITEMTEEIKIVDKYFDEKIDELITELNVNRDYISELYDKMKNGKDIQDLKYKKI